MERWHLELAARFVEALIWPAAVVASLVLLRREIRALLERVEEVGFKGLELRLRKRASVLREDVEAFPQPGGTAKPEPEIPDRLIRLATVAPRVAILESWKELDAAILRAAQRAGIETDASRHHTAVQLVEQLRGQGSIDNRLASLATEGCEVRNSFEHMEDPETITADEALVIVDTYLRVARFFDDVSAV